MSLVSLLLPPLADLVVDDVHTSPSLLSITLRSTAPTAPCPLCSERSTHPQSRYQRRLTDLVWATTPVSLVVHLRRFFCRNTACARAIFCERIGDLATPYARHTLRWYQRITDIARALGGRAGVRFAALSQLVVGRTTLLQAIRRHTLPPLPTLRRIGLDDFAFRKRHTYGTILINLDTNRVLDLLPDRTIDTVAAWLRQHPTLAVVSRDRSVQYAEAIRQGAPQATQVADRFHLSQNLTDVLVQIVKRTPTWQTILAHTPPPKLVPVVHNNTKAHLPKQVPKQVQKQHAVHTAAEARFATIKQMLAEGQSQRAVSRALGVSRQTVSHVATHDIPPPPRTRAARPTLLTSYSAYILKRWADDQPTLKILLAELRAQGYTGSKARLRAFLAPYRPAVGWHRRWHTRSDVPALTHERRRRWAARDVAWVLSRPHADLHASERAALTALVTAEPVFKTASALAQDFVWLVRRRRGTGLDDWLGRAEGCGVEEMVRFAQGLRQDYAAVKNGLTLVWSNGPTEGHVNRVKMLKRTMYGRANFDLLRARVLDGQR